MIVRCEYCQGTYFVLSIIDESGRTELRCVNHGDHVAELFADSADLEEEL